MHLVSLLLVICSPTACRVEQVPGEVTAMLCMIHGQQVAASWPMAEGERLASWRCEPGERA